MNSKECFLKVMDDAIDTSKSFVILFIEMPGMVFPEAIVNPNSNFLEKREYINKTYDENMNHRYSDGVKIIKSISTNSSDEMGTLIENFKKEYSIKPLYLN